MISNFTVIEGNIGSGKTTLVKKLAKEFSAQLILEEFEENPFLSEFLSDQKTNSLGVELQFLMDRFHQLKKTDQTAKITFADYFIEKSLIFSANNLSKIEKDLFDNYFKALFSTIKRPNLLIYLSVSSERLLKNIKLRGREIEEHINSNYLNKIHNSYLSYFEKIKENTKILIIETSLIDFVKNENDYTRIKEIILKEHPIGITNVKF